MRHLIFHCLLMLLADSSFEECLTLKDKQLQVYYGWPFEISCVEALLDLTDDENKIFDYNSDYWNISCVIKEMATENILLNSTFMVSLTDDSVDADEENPISYKWANMTKQTATKYEVLVQKDSYCCKYGVTLQPRKLPTETCEENLARVGAADQEQHVGSSPERRCDVRADEDSPEEVIRNFELDPGPDDDKVYWLYNCQNKLPNNTALRREADPLSSTLHFNDVSYDENPGNYTCVVEHNGMKRYRVHLRICVKPRATNQLSVKCNNRTAQIGKDIDIECRVDAGFGKKMMAKAKFNKLNSSDQMDLDREDAACVSYNREQPAMDSRISCQLHENMMKSTTCFFRPPTVQELDALRESFRMVYKIRNVQESDFGSYRAVIEASGEKEEAVFLLKKDHRLGLTNWQQVTIVCLAAFVGVLILFLVLWRCCGIELRWIWFKAFASAEKETRRYSAYLAYHYSDDMITTPPALLQDFVSNLTTSFKNTGGDIFDKGRDQTSDQFTADCISERLRECHRVVIIATPEYVNDHWGVYETFKAWKTVIENENAIIFVTFPKTKQAIDKLPKDMKTTLNKALKTHKVIRWDGSLPFTRRMQMQIELNMPKLPKETHFKLRPCKQKEDHVLLGDLPA